MRRTERADRITETITVKDSIINLRPIYKEKDNQEFSKWYSQRYKVDFDGVLMIVNKYCN